MPMTIADPMKSAMITPQPIPTPLMTFMFALHDETPAAPTEMAPGCMPHVPSLPSAWRKRYASTAPVLADCVERRSGPQPRLWRAGAEATPTNSTTVDGLSVGQLVVDGLIAAFTGLSAFFLSAPC